MAAAKAMANRHIVSTIVHHLSDMKYKDRRQRGPDQPVELLEFRPTLVPCILVNKLWADEGTSVLWKRYPHLPQLGGMDPTRRQYYANKVQYVFSLGPPAESSETLDYLDSLEWPSLKSLELEIDFMRHGAKFRSMLHSQLEHLELSGLQSGGSAYFSGVVLTSLFSPCRSLKSFRLGPALFSEDDSVHTSALFKHLESIPSIKTVDIKLAGFAGVDSLFTRLSQRPGLEALEIDVEPGLSLLPLLEDRNMLLAPFASLKRLTIMCYSEIALALPKHLPLLKELQLDICRIPNQPVMESDYVLLEDLFTHLLGCHHLRVLKVGIGALAIDFPSSESLPRLSGAALTRLAMGCTKLEELNLFAIEPSAIDGSLITAKHFDHFCSALPHLTSLCMKLHPSTTSALQDTALRSLGTYCHKLEVLRLKIPCQLPALPVPSIVPEIPMNSPPSLVPVQETDPQALLRSPISYVSDGSSSLTNDAFGSDSPTSTSALFPRLTHLAIARPETALSISYGSFTASPTSYSEIVDPDLEEELVRTWAHSLLARFPHLEILEAWGDSTGRDNESLNYFLPLEELLATTWEFLTGTEQDLWLDEDEEGDSSQTYESGDDWEAASYLNEFVPENDGGGLGGGYIEEPEGMITPGKTMENADYFELMNGKTVPYLVDGVLQPEEHFPRGSTPIPPAEEISALRLS